MSKQKKTTADKIGNTANTARRADRWRKIAEKRVATLRAEDASILSALADLNGLDTVEFVVGNLRRIRGIDTNTPDFEQQTFMMVDAYYDNAPTRTRTAYETDVVTQFILMRIMPVRSLDASETVALIRRYGRKGDSCTGDALARIIRAALAA